MLTIGVDLAAEPKGTAVAGIEWADGRAKLVNLMLGATDGYIVEASSSAGKIGIDCALGWPDRFVDFVVNHRAFNHEVNREFGAMDWRKDLSYRETDRRVRELTGRWPLSVATDRLGVTALRCAGLMERLGAAGVDVDRAGFGGVVEVYPAGSLKIWGFDTAGYRATAGARSTLLDAISSKAPWIDFSEFREMMVDSCDAFDAVIASLAARAAAIGSATLPSDDDLAIARVEGWIALPHRDMEKLLNIS
jgi:predicted nuclease with RNAse H fold